MAYIFRPSYTSTDPKTGKKTRKRSRTWWIRYYTPDGQRHRVKGYRDKKATETKAAELERRGIRLDAGIIDVTDELAKSPLIEHAVDFQRYLTAKGNTEEYVSKVNFRLTALLDGCKFIRVSDMQASAVVEFLAALRQSKGKSVKTANEYLAAVKGFSRWLWRDKRTRVDALAGMSKLANGDTDIRHARRDLSFHELNRLLNAARQNPTVVRCMIGADRHALYLTACATGFRVSELASMTPESFDLDTETPTATVKAACTKNRKVAVQPLPTDVANVLRDYLQSKPRDRPVWPGSWVSKAAFLIRADLRAARTQWLSEAPDDAQRREWEHSDFLAYRDRDGRYADFHCLRHTFVTMVGKAGVSPKEHQDLARHSTYALTSRYTHSRFYDLAAAVRALPIPTDGPNNPQALRATGTEGRIASKNLVPNLVPRTAISGDSERQAETITIAMPSTKNPGKQSTCAVFQGHSVGPHEVEVRGVEPLTS